MGSVDWSKQPGYQQVCLPDGTEVASAIVYDGRNLPTFENGFVSRIKDIKENFKSRESDIVIYGYMKSGTHWLWEIVRMLLDNQSERVANDVSKMNSFLETQTNEGLEKLPSPRILSTHIMPSGLPPSILDNSKVIVPIRNPKDTAVSLYHHLKSETGGTNLRCGWDTLIEKVWFDQELCFYAPWTEFTSEVWNRCREKDNYHPVVYEQLLENPTEIIRDLGSFLGITDLTQERIEHIAQETRFDNMKSKKAASEKCLESTFAEGYSMYRKGKQGDWKNHFSPEQSERFDKKMNELKLADENIRQVMLFYEL